MTQRKNMTSGQTLVQALQARRQALGMSYVDLARLSGVSLATVNRFFAVSSPKTALDSVLRLARVLGMTIQLTPEESVYRIKERSGEGLARALLGGVAAASALESQNITLADREELLAETKNRILAGSLRNLWSQLPEAEK
jgi:transcriptional regulator with XRE-family HTH domain